MFSLYRRHEETCIHRDKGIRHTRCSCPIWMDGYDANGRRQRRSLKTRDWRYAGDILERFEKGEPLPRAEAGPTLAAAVSAYLDDCRARKLAAGTLNGYETFLDHLQAAFPGARVASIDLAGLSRFRSSREVTTRTQIKEIGYVRSFFNFCVDREWMPKSPAAKLKLPKDDSEPTLPFTDDEIRLIFDACDRIDNPNKREIPRARLRARALCMLLLYTGLRISDAVKLERVKVDPKTGKLLLRMMKTRVPLYLPLRSEVLEALASLPVESKYFFWSGTAKLATAVGSARRTVECVTKLAGIDGHPHRFRDTFSVGLLRAGVDLRTVQLLLGHTSIKTTEKHYAPYVAAMQRSLDDAVAKLHFGLPADPLLDPPRNTDRNAKSNVLAFASKQRRSG